MNSNIELKKSVSPEDRRQRRHLHHQPSCVAALAAAATLALNASPVMAGGADISGNTIYSDGITVVAEDGSPLDIDGDGNVDVAIAANRANDAGSSRYHLGHGDGTFANRVRLQAGASSEVVGADMNGDMILDLVQGRRDLADLLYLGDGAGGVGDVANAIGITEDTFRVLDLAVGDLDNDGDLDIVTGNGRPGGSVGAAPQVNRYYLNDQIPGGTNTFTGFDLLADADDTRSIELADLDGDGDLDVIAGNDETTPGSNRVYLNQVAASGVLGFDEGIDFGPEDDQTAKLLVGDLNDDGRPDIVVLNHAKPPASPGINRFFLNESEAGTFALSGGTDVSADVDNTSGGALADFDGDGDLDIAVANLLPSNEGESGRNRLYLNQFVETGTVSFAPGIDISADEHMSRSMSAADLNGDGHIDIVVGNQDNIEGVSGRDRRYLNNGTADPFTNVVPVIEGAAGTLEIPEDTELPLALDDLNVTDPDNVFPADFTLTVQGGDNYTVTDNVVTPAAGFSGELSVSVVVNDGTEDSEPFALPVTVGDVSTTAPSFTSTPVEEATVGVAYSYDITAEDPDGDALVITATAAPAWLEFTDNGDGTANLSGTPELSDVGGHEVMLEVSDGAESDVQAFTITVSEETAGNNPPEFTSEAVTAAAIDEEYVYDIETADADGDAVAITATDLPDWLSLVDNGDGTATLAGTPTADDEGEHGVSLEASDGTDVTSQDFTITVSADGGGGANSAPAFTSEPVTAATEDEAYSYEITAADDDAGDELTISANTLPGWLSFSDNGDGTATLTGTPGAGDVGEHDISLEVSDGTDTAVQEFTVTVDGADDPAPTPPPSGGGGGGGGSLGFLSLLGLGLTGLWRRRRGLR